MGGGITLKSYYIFPAVVEKAGNNYGVYFPDVPGCVSTGETVNEALYLAKEGLAIHLLAMERDGEEIPEPSDVSSIKIEEGDILCLLDANIEAARKIA